MHSAQLWRAQLRVSISSRLHFLPISPFALPNHPYVPSTHPRPHAPTFRVSSFWSFAHSATSLSPSTSIAVPAACLLFRLFSAPFFVQPRHRDPILLIIISDGGQWAQRAVSREFRIFPYCQPFSRGAFFPVGLPNWVILADSWVCLSGFPGLCHFFAIRHCATTHV